MKADLVKSTGIMHHLVTLIAFMAVYIGVSHSLPSLSSLSLDATSIVFIIGFVIAAFFIWAYIEADKDQKIAAKRQELDDLVARRKNLEAEVAEIERKNYEEDLARRIAEAKYRLQLQEQNTANLMSERAELIQQAVGEWREELGESATNVRSNFKMLCPHCPSKESVAVADLNSGLTGARCFSCNNLWKF